MKNLKVFAAGFALLPLLLLGACGILYDSAVWVGSINLPDLPRGDLYDPDFYKTATLEDVQKLVGDKSLVGEQTTYSEKEFARDSRVGFIDFSKITWPFIPNHHISTTETTVRPVDVARKNSPSREVVRMLERASGISDEESFNYRLASLRGEQAGSVLEEYKAVPFNCFTASFLVDKKMLPELEAYLQQHPGANLNCTPDPRGLDKYQRAGISAPLVAAINADNPDILSLLIKKGAKLDSWEDTGTWERVPSAKIMAVLKRAGGQIPPATCDKLARGSNYSANSEYQVFANEIYGMCYFSPEVQPHMLKEAIEWNRTDLVQRLLRSGVMPQEGKEYEVRYRPGESIVKMENLLKGYGVKLKPYALSS